MRNYWLFFLVLLLASSFASAIGITPGRTTLDYEPGKEYKIDFSVINSEKKDSNIIVLVQGELNSSIAVSEVSFKMSASQGEKRMSYTFRMPQGLQPGPHLGEVVVVQLPDKSPDSETFIGASVGVATQVYVFVPYPGKYAQSDLSVLGGDSNSTVSFVMPILNLGKLDLVNVRASVDIYTKLNERVSTVQSDSFSLLNGERKELVANWKADVSPGVYRAVATILYDEQVIRVEKEFLVGSAQLELRQVEINDFTLGEIAKFEMLIDNKWSDAIKGVYAQMQVYDSEGKPLADFKSATYDIPALSSALLVSFWDTAGVRKGTYPSSLFLHYGAKTIQQDFKLEVSDSTIRAIGVGYVISKSTRSADSGSSTLVIVLFTVIGMLVIINLLWFLFLRKKLSKKK